MSRHSNLGHAKFGLHDIILELGDQADAVKIYNKERKTKRQSRRWTPDEIMSAVKDLT